MLALITALVRYAVTVLRTPPRVTSLLCTVAFVPSSNVMSATDQSSTSSTAVRWCGVLPAMPGSFVSWATSASTERARIGLPERRRPSWCLRWSTTPTGWLPMRRRAPPPAGCPRRAQADHVHVGTLDQLPHVGERARDLVMPGELLDVRARARADGGQPHAGGNEWTVVDGVQVRRKAGADDADTEGRHVARSSAARWERRWRAWRPCTRRAAGSAGCCRAARARARPSRPRGSSRRPA